MFFIDGPLLFPACTHRRLQIKLQCGEVLVEILSSSDSDGENVPITHHNVV